MSLHRRMAALKIRGSQLFAKDVVIGHGVLRGSRKARRRGGVWHGGETQCMERLIEKYERILMQRGITGTRGTHFTLMKDMRVGDRAGLSLG